MKKVLIFEDDEKIQERIDYQLNSEEDTVLIIKATSLSEAERELAIHHADTDLIVLDGCLNSYDDPDGVAMIPDIRAVYPHPRPILAISSSDMLRMMMIERGCTHECKKNFVSANILHILEIKR